MRNEEKILDILASMSLRLGSVDTRLEKIDDRMTKLEFQIETNVGPRLQALAEGHSAILEQLVPCTRVDELEERVKFLESMMRSMNEELQRLKAI